MVLAAVRRATAAIADKIRCFMGNLRFPPMKVVRQLDGRFNGALPLIKAYVAAHSGLLEKRNCCRNLSPL
jgi:hypothetical protein